MRSPLLFFSLMMALLSSQSAWPDTVDTIEEPSNACSMKSVIPANGYPDIGDSRVAFDVDSMSLARALAEIGQDLTNALGRAWKITGVKMEVKEGSSKMHPIVIEYTIDAVSSCPLNLDLTLCKATARSAQAIVEQSEQIISDTFPDGLEIFSLKELNLGNKI